MDAVIYQNGNFSGLKSCIASIIKYSPTSKIHLIGRRISDFVFIPEDPYRKLANSFEKIYEHHSVNPREFELRCFQRWCIISEYAHAVGLEQFFVCDSDVLVFCDLAQASRLFRCKSYTMPMGSSFVYDLRFLDVFIKYCFWYYQHPSNNYRARVEKDYHSGTTRSISDMTIADRLANLVQAKVASDETLDLMIDPNIALRNGFVSENNQKKIRFLFGCPYCQRESGGLVRLLTLHCWGPAKEKMAWYLSESEKSL